MVFSKGKLNRCCTFNPHKFLKIKQPGPPKKTKLDLNFTSSTTDSSVDYNLTSSTVAPTDKILYSVVKSQRGKPFFINMLNDIEFSYQQNNCIRLEKNGTYGFTLKCSNRENKATICCKG